MPRSPLVTVESRGQLVLLYSHRDRRAAGIPLCRAPGQSRDVRAGSGDSVLLDGREDRPVTGKVRGVVPSADPAISSTSRRGLPMKAGTSRSGRPRSSCSATACWHTEQGYASIPPIYGQFNDPWLKKDDPHIKFLTDQLEAACAAFASQRFGEMFECFGAGIPRIRCHHQDKVAWAEAMQALIALRLSGSIG